ncbi:hypothetical protein LRAMOSA06281 [Lichtheimia ramosa]|uniref:Etoposide-induced protein 2.4 n=1 Tax=Lichtheimia ramosa TaxID=688394 RepID=A0A077X2R8_9FUNG|nr:hypothetical protein LRAMOSA06281 [Lichtheimia ramosa]
MALVVRMSVAEHVDCFLDGFCQAFCWSRAATLIHSSHAVQRSLVKTILLNGVIFLGILFFVDSFYNTPEHTLFGYSYTTLTGYPMYMLCLMTNAGFFSRIAKEAFRMHGGEYQRHDNSESISAPTTIGMGILYMSCAAFIRCLRVIPLIGTPLSFYVNCLFMAYYCFEYKWMHMGWSLEHRLAHVEKHWAFFFGFGLPATLLTFFLSTLHAGAVFALIFPSYVIMATMSTMKSSTAPNVSVPLLQKWYLPNRIPVFWPVGKVTYTAIDLVQLFGVVDMKAAFTENKDQLGKVV